MIEVSHLTKYYGSFLAVDDLSFTIPDGHVYGFLGPNGAGKSTTMNIMTGCLSPTAGKVTIDGHDILTEPEAAKRCMGYLPEQPPLYLNETPWEYLTFVGEAKGLQGGALRSQIESVMERTKITEMGDRPISALSKGYKQRVGIAQALLGDPKVVILDEPTVAVDPQSRNKILEGIKQLNEQGSTIIYTSHYMEEVEQICTRIAIIDHGRVLASGTTEELKKMIKTGETITIEAVALTKNNLADIRSLSHVFDLSYQDQTMILRCSGAKHNLIRVLNYLQEQDIPFGRVFSELPTLNDVFLEITGKELRD